MEFLNILCIKSVINWTQIISNIATIISVFGAILTILIGIKSYKKQKQIDALMTYYSNIKRHLKILLHSVKLDGQNFNVLYYFSKNDEDIRDIRDYDRDTFEKLRVSTIKSILTNSTFASFEKYEKDYKSDSKIYEKDLTDFNETFNDIALECCVEILLRELIYLQGITADKKERPQLFDNSKVMIKYAQNFQAIISEIITRIETYFKKEKL